MRKIKKVNMHIRDREMSGEIKRLKRKMEVQVITFNYFSWPQPRDLNLFSLCDDDDGHTKNIVVRGFKFCCGFMGWPE